MGCVLQDRHTGWPRNNGPVFRHDDVSWMYLDAENSLSIDSFHLINFDKPYSAW
jgi:hypothetical protein